MSASYPDPRPGPGKEAALVQAMFDRVAPRYDLANSLFSFGQDRHWRRVTARALGRLDGQTVLDVAGGTGALARELTAMGARVVVADLSWNMVSTGARRIGAGVLWCVANGSALPFADASVDVVTIAFGLRNLPDPAAGLAEFRRVVRPGGQLAVLEFSRPVSPLLAAIYQRYLLGAIPAAAKLVTSDPTAYRYLAASIQAWPDQAGLARMITQAGWVRVRWKNLSGGIVALHHGLA